ncbi:FK506-binding protein 2 [Lingula anatina]|uniref:peptidylprolyl isomerase n=1 Tax=Lingula anatina TaxID=7574 RepID=A0A1S3J6E3_LINAN|nr:FK506-binding protein 2 [Lingula anatina]|eukprot:XP_013405821.1 FK506-binding protein 2 [Lingula anatina]
MDVRWQWTALQYITCSLLIVECAKKKKELQIITEHKPADCSVKAGDGDHVEVHYTGKLDDGSVFDSSRTEGRSPLPFTLGAGKVIPGWEQGILGMCVGEKRKLIIPSHLAYGKKGHPPVIPGGATLHFDTELVGLTKKTVEGKLLKTLQFLLIPAAVLMLLYYLYERLSQAPAKEEKKSKKKRR